jgi:hypothetical protein
MRHTTTLKQLGLLLCVAVVAAIVVAGAASLPAAERMSGSTRGRPRVYEPGKIAVKLRPAATRTAPKARSPRFGIESLDEISEELRVRGVAPMFPTCIGARRPHLPSLGNIYLVELPTDVNVGRAAVLFGRSPLVEYAEALPICELALTPDDPLFHDQDHLPQIMAEAAWDVHKGQDGAEVVVGTAETGVKWRHSDLVDNIYQNLGEDLDGDGRVIERSGDSWIFDPGDVNGADDDGNGYPDDFIGWNFFNDDGGEDNNPDDPSPTGHGTFTAGLIAACTDNSRGVASISWNVKILPTSSQNSRGMSLSANFQAWVYLAENGADVIYCPLVGSQGPRTRLMQEVTEYVWELGTFMVSPVAANFSSELSFPASLPGVVSVTNLTNTDMRRYNSNYGIGVDIAAPGTNLLSTALVGGYERQTGPCSATAVTTGVFALVKSLYPDLSNEQLIQRVLATADNIDDVNPGFEGQLGDGRVNAFRALTEQVTPQPKLRLEVQGVRLVDDTGDGSIGPGEGAEVFLTVRNHSHMPGSQALALTLSSDSEFVDVINSTMIVDMRPDTLEELSNPLSVQVAADAPSGAYELKLTAEASDADISALSTLVMPKLLVANGGLLVWEGYQRDTFSGRYLRDELQARGFEVTYAVGDFPTGLSGFDGVFLSFGNNGPPLWEVPRLDADWKVDAIRRYLEGGGRLYLEGGDTLGYDIFNIVDGAALLTLFGLDSAEDGGENVIDALDGHTGALTEGMQFSQTSQASVSLIDIFTPATGAAAFTESDYGIVAVQHEGAFGQRTFCFSYALADLVDGSTTRADLLDSILAFFALDPDDEDGRRMRRPIRRRRPAS